MTDSGSNISIWLTLGAVGIPFLSFIACFLISQKFGWLAPIVTSILALLSFLCAVSLFFILSPGSSQDFFYNSWPWFSINDKIIHASLLIDNTASSMLLVVSLVSLLVHLFSIGYMAEDQNQIRYFAMLGFFTFAMLALVISSNLLITFCFWELVGFSSYRLIGHWQEKPLAAKAATKSFIINKVGDLGFLIGLMILWTQIGTFEISNSTLAIISPGWLTAAGLCIFLGVVAKSAQFPLFNWLPDAMEGPTPVSALIHAATMVAAGVFLLIRFGPLFTNDALAVIAVTGAITALAGALGALFQYDIKKILAYSTISQLGFMVMAIGAGAAQGGYLHLLHHAFFKAGLFLSAGAIIHAMHQAYHHNQLDVQDIRNLGGLRKKLPITFITFIIFAAALSGLPFTSGFVSKEIILTEMAAMVGNEFSLRWIVVGCAWIVTALTPLYAVRLAWYIFFSKPKQEHAVEEVPIIMRLPLIILAIGSLAMITSLNHFHFSSSISVLVRSSLTTSIIISLLSTAVILLAMTFAYFLYRKQELSQEQKFTAPHFFLDKASTWLSQLTIQIAFITKRIDRGIDQVIHILTYLQVTLAHMIGWTDRNLVDGLVNGIAYSSKGIGSITRSLANGKIQSYLLWAMAGLTIFIFWILY